MQAKRSNATQQQKIALDVHASGVALCDSGLELLGYYTLHLCEA
jgi:hypothetical protein